MPQQPQVPDARVSWPKQYELVDGWRGLAALLVVCHHAFGITYGHWGVLIFFVISGYCISASLDSCQSRGLGRGRSD